RPRGGGGGAAGSVGAAGGLETAGGIAVRYGGRGAQLSVTAATKPKATTPRTISRSLASKKFTGQEIFFTAIARSARSSPDEADRSPLAHLLRERPHAAHKGSWASPAGRLVDRSQRF